MTALPLVRGISTGAAADVGAAAVGPADGAPGLASFISGADAPGGRINPPRPHWANSVCVAQARMVRMTMSCTVLRMLITGRGLFIASHLRLLTSPSSRPDKTHLE